MIKYREILSLRAQGLSMRSIAASCSNARNTVSEVLKRAESQGISWPFEKDMSDDQLQEVLFPEKNTSSNFRRGPDCEYIHKEMAEHYNTTKSTPPEI